MTFSKQLSERHFIENFGHRIDHRSLSRLLSRLIVAALLPFSTGLLAHPMGNFTISHYAGLTIKRGFVEVHYFVDMAEIPTFQEFQQSGVSSNPDDPRLQSYVASKAGALGQGLRATLNGRLLTLRPINQGAIFPPGAGRLPTMKLGFVYDAVFAEDCGATPCELEYLDTNFPDRAGWKEIVVSAGPGITLVSSTAPASDRSRQLSDYPTDLLNSPPQALQARIDFSTDSVQSARSSPQIRPGTPTADPTRKGVLALNAPPRSGSRLSAVRSLPMLERPQELTSPESNAPEPGAVTKLQIVSNRQTTPRNSFTELMETKQISWGAALFAAIIAAGLGALHALEPGHGKTIVASYLVGSKGTGRHAFLLGVIVTASHTAGVYLLGAVTLYAQQYILPDRIYPILGVLSGTLIAGMGGYLFLQRCVGVEFSHTHSYEILPPQEGAGNVTRRREGRVSISELFVLGVTGGIIPCPAALVVLLSAVALHRAAFGLYLIVAFSIGLAAVLIGMGLVTVYAGRMMSRLPIESRLLQHWLPMTSAAMLSLVGCSIAVRGLMSAGILQIPTFS